MARIQDCTFVSNGKEYTHDEFRALLYKSPGIISRQDLSKKPISEEISDSVAIDNKSVSNADLSAMSQDQYAEYLAQNGLPDGVSAYDALTSAPEHRGLTGRQRVELFNSRREESIAWRKRAEEIWIKIRNNAQAGISAIGATSGWTNFGINEFRKKKDSQETHKSYISIKDYVSFSEADMQAVLTALQQVGFNGQIKFPGQGSRALLAFDNIVMHGNTESDAELALSTIQNLFGDRVSGFMRGKDAWGKSHTQLLAESVEERLKQKPRLRDEKMVQAGEVQVAQGLDRGAFDAAKNQEKQKNEFEKQVNIQEEPEVKDKTDIGDIPDDFILGSISSPSVINYGPARYGARLMDLASRITSMEEFDKKIDEATFRHVRDELSSILGESFVLGDQFLIGSSKKLNTDEKFLGFVQRVLVKDSNIPNAYKAIMGLNSDRLWDLPYTAKSVAKHEAIHFIIWDILSPEERKAIHKAAVKAWKMNGSPIIDGYDPNNTLKQAEEWLARTYETYTRNPTKMEKIPGIIGRFFRWLYDTYQRIVNNRSEIEEFLASVNRGDFRNKARGQSLMHNNLSYKDYSQLFSDENIENVTDREYSNSIGDFFKAQQERANLDKKGNKLPMEAIQALRENSDITRDEEENLVRNQFDNIGQIRKNVFGSDYVYLRAVQILKDKLNSNGIYAKDMKYEFIHGDSPASKNKHIYSAWADFYSVAERLIKNQSKTREPFVINGVEINSAKDLNADLIKYIPKDQKVLIDQYIAIQLAQKEILAPMIESVYELNILDIVNILGNDQFYENNDVNREIEETLDTEERAENAVYADRMTRPVIDKQSKLLKFRISTINRYKLQNSHILGQEVNKNINNGNPLITKTSDFIPVKALEEVMRNISNSPISNAQELRTAILRRIKLIPDGEEKNILISLWTEVFDSKGAWTDISPGNQFPVISHYAFINRTNEELWAEHVKYAKGLNNKIEIDRDDQIVFFNKVITKDQFFKWADRKRVYSEDIYNAITSMYVNTGFISTSKGVMDGDFVSIRENGFGSANSAMDQIRTGLMSKIIMSEGKPVGANEKIFFGEKQEYDHTQGKEAARVEFLVNKDGVYFRHKSGRNDKERNYINIVEIKDGKFVIPGGMVNEPHTHKTYLVKFLRASGLESRFGIRVWNEIVASKEFGMEFLLNTAGMYAVMQDLGMASLSKLDIEKRWSYKMREGISGLAYTKPLENDTFGKENKFFWPTDLLEINKTIAAAYMAGNQIGFMSSTKDINGNTMYLHENKSFFNRVIQNRAEIVTFDKDGKISESQDADVFLKQSLKNDIADGNLFSNLKPDISDIPNSFINPLYGKGRDRVLAYYENLGMQGEFSGSAKDQNFNINDEFNFAIDFFEKGLRENIGTRGGLKYVVPLQAFGDHETTYVKIQLGDEGILGLNGEVDMWQVAQRVKSIMEYYEMLHKDSILRLEQEFKKATGIDFTSSNFEIQSNTNPNFTRLIEKSGLIKNVDYVVSKDGKAKLGKAPMFNDKDNPSHKIFNLKNLETLRKAESKLIAIAEIENIFYDSLNDFGKTISGYAFNGVSSHVMPKTWRSKGEKPYKDGQLNPYYKGFYFIQFITRHQIMPILGADAFTYKDSIDRQKRISQMKTPISTPSDSGNIFGGYIRATIFKDLSTGSGKYETGIGPIDRSKISETDGFGIMHPIFAEGAYMAFGGDAGLINEGNQKFLSNYGGMLWKASWGKISDDVLINDMNDDPDGYSYWNIIENGFIDPAMGKRFVEELRSELEKKKSSTEKYSAVRKVSRDWVNKIRAGEFNTPGISNHVVGFFMADSGVKTKQSRVNLLTDNDLATNSHSIPVERFGHIMDPSQNIYSDPRASSPIQVITQAAWAKQEQADAVYDLWSRIIEAQNKERAVPIEELRERYIKTISTVGAFGHAAEMLTDPGISINLPGLSGIIRSSHMSAVQRNQVRFSVPGARMTQQPGRNIRFVDENGKTRSLKPVLFKEEGGKKVQVEPGWVFMPHMFLDKFFDEEELATLGNFITPEIIRAKLSGKSPETKQAFEDSLMIFADRIPSGGLNSGYVMKIAGFVNDNQNTIYLPSEVNVLNGADYDIDQLQVWVLKPSMQKDNSGKIETIIKRDESVVGLTNQLLDKFFEIYKDPENAPFTGNTTNLDVPTDVRDYVIKSLSSGEGGKNQANSFVNNDDYTGDLVRKNVVALGSVAIGRFANISKAASLVKQAGPSVLGSGFDIKPYSIQEIDKWLNAALDNEKNNILGILSARPELGDFIIAYTIMNFDPNSKWKMGDKEYTGAGSTFLELAQIFNGPVMKRLISDLEKLSTVNLKNDKDNNIKSWEIEEGIGKKILGLKPSILDLIALQRRRAIDGMIRIENDPDGLKIEKELDKVEKIAAFGEALSRIGLGLPVVTNVPKTEHAIRNVFQEVSSMVGKDALLYLKEGGLATDSAQIEAARMKRYQPISDINTPEYRYFAKKEELINSAIDFGKFIEASKPIKSALSVLANEWEKQKQMFKIDLNERVFDQAQKFYNDVMNSRGLVSDSVLEETRNHFNRYLISLYYTMNPVQINQLPVNVATDEDRGDELDGPIVTLDISKFDLSTYSGRQGFLMTVPIWFKAKVNELRNSSDEQIRADIDNNLFWKNIEIYEDNGITVFKMRNMNQIKEIKDEIKHDAYLLFNQIDPNGGVAEVIKNYQIILNGFNYGKGSMSIVFEANEFYGISDFIENTIVPAMEENMYDQKILNIRGQMFSMQDIINGEFQTQLMSFIESQLPEFKEKKDKEDNIPLEKPGQLIWQMEYKKSEGANAWRLYEDGVDKIKMRGVGENVMAKARKLGYNTIVSPDNKMSIFTSTRTIRTVNGSFYVDLQNNGGIGGISIPYGSMPDLNSAVYVDGMRAIVSGKSNPGYPPKVYLTIQDKNEVFISKKTNVSDRGGSVQAVIDPLTGNIC